MRRLQRFVRLIAAESDRFARRHLALALLCVLSSSLLTALAPLALKLAVDELAWAVRETSLMAILVPVVGYAAAEWLARSFTDAAGFEHGRAEQRITRRLGSLMLKHTLTLPLAFHLDRSTGALNQTLLNGLVGLRLVLRHLVFTVAGVTTELLAMATVLLHLGHQGFLAILAIALLAYALAFAYGVMRISPAARAVAAAQSDAAAVLTDSMLNCETIKYFDANALVLSRYDATLARTEGLWQQFFRRNFRNGLAVATVFALSLCITVLYAGLNVRKGVMTVGDFVLVTTYLIASVRPLEMLGFALREVAQGLSFVERLLDLLQQRPEARTAGRTAPARPIGRLVFENVRMSYDGRSAALQDVSFEILRGQTVAVVGPSGSGKSSLVRALLGLSELDEGRILFDGLATCELDVSSLRRGVGVVPQDTVLFNDTIARNIEVGMPGCSFKEIRIAAELVRLDEFVATLPQGYDTIVGERGLKLSGGERQRIAIARAVVKRPELYVFDEATASLDMQTEQEILENLAHLARSTTTLMIAHRLSTVVHASHIIVLERGRIVERGSHLQLLRLNGLYARMWCAQSRRGLRQPRASTAS